MLTELGQTTWLLKFTLLQQGFPRQFLKASRFAGWRLSGALQVYQSACVHMGHPPELYQQVFSVHIYKHMASLPQLWVHHGK